MAKTKAAGYRQEKDGTWTIDTKVKVDGDSDTSKSLVMPH